MTVAAVAAICLVPGVLWGKPPPRSTAGASFGPTFDRPVLPLRMCDTTMPVCVHADRAVSADDFRRLRHATARAYALIVETLRLPAPLPDGPSGGDPRLDVYLTRSAKSAGGTDSSVPAASSDPLRVGRDALDLIADRDAAPAFLLVDVNALREGDCALEAVLARGMVRASAMGLDAAETNAVVDGFARYLGSLVTGCREGQRARFDELQRAPFRSLVDGVAGPERLAAYLDTERGLGFGAIVPGLLSMSVQHRGVVIPVEDDDLGPVHLHNDPSVFDVLSATLSDQGSSLDELLLDLAVSRAFEPTAPALEWRIPVSTVHAGSGRRLAVSRGIEPTGATFVRIDLDETVKEGGIELDLKWEQGARFRFTVLKLDAQGRRVGEVTVAPLDREREVTVEVRKLEGVAGILLVGINGGDPIKTWHADDPGLPAHGYEIGVYRGS